MGLFGKSRAEVMTDMAQEFIDEGNELKEEYQQLAHQAEQRVNDLNHAITEDAKYKEQVVHEIGITLQGTLKKFQSLEYHPQEISIENYNVNIKDDTLLKKGLPGTIDLIDGITRLTAPRTMFPDPPMHDFLSKAILKEIFGDSEEEEIRAYQAHQNARKYMYQVSEAVQKMKNYLIGLDTMIKLVKDDQKTIQSLMEKIHYLSNSIQEISMQQKITEEKVKSIKSLYIIAEKISNSVKDMVIDSRGNISENYSYYVNELKKIDATLPDTPKISDSRTNDWMEFLLKAVVVK